MSIKWRLLLLTVIWFSISFAIIAFVYHQEQTKLSQQTRQSLHRDLATHMRDDNPLMVGVDYNPVALKSIFHTLMLIGPDFEIYFLDSQGQITTHAAPEGRLLNNQISLTPIKQFLSNAPLPILGDDPLNLTEPTVFSVAEISEGDEVMGYLYVVIGSTQHDQLIAAQPFWPYGKAIGLTFLAMLGFSGLVYRLIDRRLLQPMAAMSAERNTLSGGLQDLLPQKRVVKELQPIIGLYQSATKQIQQQFLQIEFQSAAQKQQIIQLNHDLKTPLASILGYLETWQLQRADEDKLIAVAYQNAHKLRLRLDHQLDLARQDFALPHYDQQPIDIQPIINSVCAMLLPQLKAKQVTIKTCIHREGSAVICANNQLGNAPVWVNGDESLLCRLFENLLDNALRHSPEGNDIDLTLTMDECVNITVSNAIDVHARSGELGLGQKISQAILVLHQSVLHTEVSSTEYRQQFQLPFPPM